MTVLVELGGRLGQAALRTLISICLSVCRPSVCDTFLTEILSSYHHGISRSYYHWQIRCPCKMSRSEVKGQGHRDHDPTQPFPDRNSSLNSHIVMKWCTRLDVPLGEVPYCFSRSSVKFQSDTAKKIIDFDPNWAFLDCNSSLNSPWLWNDSQSLKQHKRGALLFFKVICQISRSHRKKKCWFWPELGISGV